MKTLVYITFYIALIIFSTQASAQDCQGKLERATKDYEQGHLFDAIDSLKAISEGDCETGYIITAHKLLAMCYLALDSTDLAKDAIKAIMSINTKYKPGPLDPRLFSQLVDEVKEEHLATVITSVSKSEEILEEVPATVTIITAEEIRERGYLDIEALFHDLSGFDITRSNGLSYSNIYPRGYRSSTQTDRLLIMVDGVEENHLWSNIAYISRQYSLTAIKRVEIVYGPASTMYGANAFIGVINIVTQDDTDLIGKKQRFAVHTDAGFGQWKTRWADLTAAVRFNQTTSLNITGRVYQSDEMNLSGHKDGNWDYTPGSTEDYASLFTLPGSAYNALDFPVHPYYSIQKEGDNVTAIIPTEQGINKAMELDEQAFSSIVNGNKIGFSNQTDDWFLNASFKLDSFKFTAQIWNRAEGYNSQSVDIYRAGSKNGGIWTNRHLHFSARYDKSINNKLSVTSFTRYKTNGNANPASGSIRLKGYINKGFDLLDLTRDSIPYWYNIYRFESSNQLRSELKTVYTPNRQVKLISGIEYRYGQIQGDYYETDTPDPQINGLTSNNAIPGGNHYENIDLGIYTQLNYKSKKEKLHINAGARYDRNWIRREFSYGNMISPRFALVYMPLKNKEIKHKLYMKAIYSEAFKDATNQNKFSSTNNRVPNPELTPEQVKNYELSIRHQYNETANLELIAYNSKYSHILELASFENEDGAKMYRFEASGTVHIKGLQINADAKLASFKWGKLKAFGNYTYTNPQNTTEEKRIGDIASNRINLGVNLFHNSGVNFNLRMNHVGKRLTGKNTTVEGNIYNSIDPYTVFNSALTYYFNQKLLKGSCLQLVVNNIFNNSYYHPGIRSASGSYAARIPQNERNIFLRFCLHISK